MGASSAGTRGAWRWRLGFVVTLPFVMFPFSEAYVVTHSGRAFVPPPQLGAPHENVSFTTSDGLRLHGWFVPSKNGATVISFPGRKGPQKPARLLVSEGYGVLLFDRRGEGESDGDPNALGWRGTRDLDAAIAYLRSRPDVDPDRIGGVGLSVGGEMMLQAAAQNDDFKAIVSEGAGVRSVRESVHTEGTEKIVPLLDLRPGHGRNGRLRQRPASAEPHRPQCRDHRTGALHPRDTGSGRRDADREVLRGGEGPEGVLACAGRAHRRLRRRAAGVRAANRRFLRPAPARPFVLTPARVAHSVCHDAPTPEPGQRCGACDDAT